MQHHLGLFIMEDLPDLYELLQADENATERELQKAFRQQAIKCHPDKNPTKQAAERFHLLTIAIEKLTNVSSRAAYDKARLQKREAALRRDKIDQERKIWIEELEKGEKNAAQNEPHGIKRQWRKMMTEEEQLAVDGARLRTELQAKRKSIDPTSSTGKSVLEQGQKRPSEQPKKTQIQGATVAVRYRGEHTTLEDLKKIFEAYGIVQDIALRMINHKTKLALIIFASSTVAHEVVSLCPADLSTADIVIRQMSMLDFCEETGSHAQSPAFDHSRSNNTIPDRVLHNELQNVEKCPGQSYESSVLSRMKQRQREKKDRHN